MAYTNEQRAQAKALVITAGSGEKAAAILGELWDEAPTGRSIQNWVNDPTVEPDLAFLRTFSDTTNARIVHWVDRLVGPLGQRIEREIEDGTKSLDLHNDVRSFTFLANLIRPADASGAGGTNVYNYVEAGPARVVMPFSPKEPPIDA